MISDNGITDVSYCELPKIKNKRQHIRLFGSISWLTKVFAPIGEFEQIGDNAMAFIWTPKNTVFPLESRYPWPPCLPTK